MNQILIIGGGIAGLFCASKLKTQYPNKNIVVVECRPRLGGRIRSIYDKEHAFVQDAGSWRIHESHTNMMNLAKDLNIKMKCIHSSICNDAVQEAVKHSIDPEPAFSLKESLVFSKTRDEIHTIEKEHGFLGSLDGAQRTYSISSKAEGVYYSPQNGMSAYINALEKQCKTLGVHILLNTRVYSVYQSLVPGKYNVKTVLRTGNTFKKQDLKCDTIIFTIPPHALNNIKTNFNIHLRCIVKSLQSLPLLRVYLNLKKGKSINQPFYIVTQDPLGHLISINDNKFMATYCSGYLAGWHWKSNMFDPKTYLSNLKMLYTQNFHKYPSLPHPEDVDFSQLGCQCYWEHAVHIWKPEVTVCSKHPPVKNACLVHETELPNFYLCGEAYSDEQGWAEGCLKTSNIVLHAIEKRQHHDFKVTRKVKTKHHIVYNKKLINIKNWLDAHPGGRKAILNHIDDKDIAQLILQVHNHSDKIYCFLLGMEDGYA